jgi:hypothetical protein
LKPGLTVLIATRGRPKQFLNAVNSALATSDEAVISAYVDLDDPCLKDYSDICIDRLCITFGERVGSAKALKVLLKLCDTEFIMLGSDDIVFETPHWDEKLVSVLPADGIGISFGEDKNERQCNHFAFHRRLYELTDLWPDVFWHFGPDGYLGNVIRAVGKERRVFNSQVVIRHLQAKANKSPRDKTFEEERTKGNASSEMRKALEFFHRDVETLKAACQS